MNLKYPSNLIESLLTSSENMARKHMGIDCREMIIKDMIDTCEKLREINFIFLSNWRVKMADEFAEKIIAICEEYKDKLPNSRINIALHTHGKEVIVEVYAINNAGISKEIKYIKPLSE
jgi:hypothetical protein